MDFHSLNRKELQSLCKLNKIPANITNIAMADALQSLQIVVGIEEFLKVSPSETADLGEKVEVPSPKAPHTRCRTSTRPKAKLTETKTLPSTVTRTTRRGSKQLPTEVEDSKNKLLLQTPASPNVSYRLNECENEAKEVNKYSTRRSTRLTEKKSAAPRVKKEVEKAVEIDSVLAVTSKDHEEVRVETEVEDICKALEKLDVLVVEEEATHKSCEEDEDSEVNSTKLESHETTMLCEDGDLEDSLKISEVKTDEICDLKPESDGISSPSEEATHTSGEEDEDCEVNSTKQESHETTLLFENGDLEDSLKISEVKTDEICDLKPESDGISSPSEEATHTSGEEEYVDCDEVSNNLNQELHEISNLCEDNLNTSEVKNDVKPDSDDISNPYEDEKLVQKLDLGESFTSAMKEHNHVLVQEENSDSNDITIPFEDENLEKKLNSINMSHNPTEFSATVIDDNEISVDEIATKEITEMSEDQTVDETFDVIPMDSTMSKEAEDLKPEVFPENSVNEKSDAESSLTQNPSMFLDATAHLAQMTFVKIATPFKNMPTAVSDDKENIVDEENVRKKEKNEMGIIKSLNETSIRQLKKQLKALTLKHLNSKEEAAATTRQALCENQMVVGAETEI